MGDITSPDTSDIGLNVIHKNGNSGKIFDLYNNTIDSIKAENNFWGTNILDSIEAHIFHKPDSAVLGYVDYLPVSSNLVLNVTVGLEGLVRVSGRMGRNDTVTVILRDTAAPYAVIDSARGVIDSATYTGTFSFAAATESHYYIVVRHFNSIETWSKAGGEFLTTSLPNSYSFITDASQAYGNNLVLTRNRYCMFTGDVNQDRAVTLVDLLLVNNSQINFTTGIRLPEDLTGDSIVDLRDIIRCSNNVTLFVRVVSPLNP